ncbi:MAG: MFS transporter [Acidobacteriota bacterium]|nr:MFS transporter [Acidobacteriota bacterium]
MENALSRRCILLLAFTGGATVANLYYSQPLLAMIGSELRVTPAAMSFVSTATQLGYAAGLLLLVPLGDAFERRRLLVTMTVCIFAALLFVAASHSLTMLIISSAILGATTIVPQLVVPFAAHLAPAEARGRVVGSVMSGLLIGVIISRTVSGFIAGFAGWRLMYVIAAGAMLVIIVLLRTQLPREPAAIDLRYGELLRSLGHLVRTQPLLRRHALIGAAGFGAFSIFWTTLAFHLARLSPEYGTKTVGTFGLVGVAGALIAPFAGRFADRYGTRLLNISGLALMLLAYALMVVRGGASLIVLGAGVILLDAGEQASHIANQSRIFALEATLRNRLNAVYMVAFFIGGAAGSLIGGYAWQHGGWLRVCAAGAAFALAGLAAAIRRDTESDARAS